jgi:hypothetical protein
MSSLTSLTLLTNLELSENAFTGVMPNLAALSRLTSLDLRQNPTLDAGPIPNFFASMPGLTYLDLGTTSRTSTLPASLETLNKLYTLDVQVNQLIGTISPAIAALPFLETFAVRSNSFTGSVPTALARTSLSVLHLGSNRFSGSLSSHPFTSANTYVELSVTGNRMTGSMPEFSLSAGATFPVDVDITVGGSLGEFIADGESCLLESTKCSSGASSCGSSGVCCAAIYDAPHTRGSCSLGFCMPKTGSCALAPGLFPSMGATEAPVGRLGQQAPTPTKKEDELPLTPIIGSAFGVAVLAGVLLRRVKTKQKSARSGTGGPTKKMPKEDEFIQSETGSDWLPNPNYVVMGGTLPTVSSGTSVGSVSISTMSNSGPVPDARPANWSNMSSGVLGSFRGHPNDATSVAHISI